MHVFPRQVKWKEDEVGWGEKKEEGGRGRDTEEVRERQRAGCVYQVQGLDCAITNAWKKTNFSNLVHIL